MTESGSLPDQLQVDYADAWLEWVESCEAAAWEGVAGDGLST
jgi:hypothetical protein